MKNVGKFLVAIAFCSGILMALLSFTAAKSAVTNKGVIQPDVSLSNNDIFNAVPKESASYGIVVETLTDRCSSDVVVKVPYADSPSLDGEDIILARSEAMCRLLEEGMTFRGVCKHGKYSSFTEPISYSSIANSARRFRWFCGLTPERSRCGEGTTKVRFRIGPNRLFQTQCLK